MIPEPLPPGRFRVVLLAAGCVVAFRAVRRALQESGPRAERDVTPADRIRKALGQRSEVVESAATIVEGVAVRTR